MLEIHGSSCFDSRSNQRKKVVLNRALSYAGWLFDQLNNHRRTSQFLLWFATIIRLRIAFGIARKKSLRHKCRPCMVQVSKAFCIHMVESRVVQQAFIIVFRPIACCVFCSIIDRSIIQIFLLWSTTVASSAGAIVTSSANIVTISATIVTSSTTIVTSYAAIVASSAAIIASSATIVVLPRLQQTFCHHHGKLLSAAIMTSFLPPSWQAFCLHRGKLSAAIMTSFLPPSWQAPLPSRQALLPSWQVLLPSCHHRGKLCCHRGKLCRQWGKLCHHWGKLCCHRGWNYCTGSSNKYGG